MSPKGLGNVQRMKVQHSVKLVNHKQEFDHLMNSSVGKTSARTPGKKKKKKKSTIQVVEEINPRDYEFGLKTCMIIHQRRYGKFRQLNQIQGDNFPDLMESESDTEKVKMQVKSMGIGIEEMYEFTDS